MAAPAGAASTEGFAPFQGQKGIRTMGLAWQQGPLAPGAVGHFLTADPLPERMLYAEPLRRRTRVLFGGTWIADSDHVVLLHEPGRYPVAYFPLADTVADVLEASDHSTSHRDLGPTAWYAVHVGGHNTPRAAWLHTQLPSHAEELKDRVAFAWRAMDGFYEEEERIVGHAADMYHRIDIRQTGRHLLVRHSGRVIADSTRPLALYESGFAPRWYVPRADVDESVLVAVEIQTFCPYKGLCSYYDIGDARQAAWCYEHSFEEVKRVSNLLSFEPDRVSVEIDGTQLRPEPGQNVISHGVDRNLTIDEAIPPRRP
jgi:uncharacterized protein (DUF427 family)